MKKIALALVIVGITGCATKPVTNEQAKNIPSKQILNPSLFTKKEGTGKVIIKRDSGFMLSLIHI